MKETAQAIGRWVPFAAVVSLIAYSLFMEWQPATGHQLLALWLGLAPGTLESGRGWGAIALGLVGWAVVAYALAAATFVLFRLAGRLPLLAWASAAGASWLSAVGDWVSPRAGQSSRRTKPPPSETQRATGTERMGGGS